MNWTDKVSGLPECVEPADVLFAWTVEDGYPRFNEHEDIATAYLVQSEPQADCGIMIWAKHRGEWVVNPYSTRALVRKLVTLITPPTQGEELPLESLPRSESMTAIVTGHKIADAGPIAASCPNIESALAEALDMFVNSTDPIVLGVAHSKGRAALELRRKAQ